jgi:hypothetical protein
VVIRITAADIRTIARITEAADRWTPTGGDVENARRLLARLYRRVGAESVRGDSDGTVELTEHEINTIARLREDILRGADRDMFNQLMASFNMRLGRAQALTDAPAPTTVVPSIIDRPAIESPDHVYTLATRLPPDESEWLSSQLDQIAAALNAGDRDQAHRLTAAMVAESRDGLSLLTTLVEGLQRHQAGEPRDDMK